jgi:hypothetical protein
VIVITGPGRSGTSLLAMLYREMGFDPGGGWKPDVHAGLEATRFAQVNDELATALGTVASPRRGPRRGRSLDRLRALGNRRLPESASTRVNSVLGSVRYRSQDLMDWPNFDLVVSEFGERLRTLAATAQVVKDPRFCWTLRAWLASGAPISAVVLALRPLDAMVESRVHAGMIPDEGRTWAKDNFAYGIGLVMSAVVEYRVPFEVLRFPDFLDDPRDLYERLPLPQPRTWEAFHDAFVSVCDSSLVHDRR